MESILDDCEKHATIEIGSIFTYSIIETIQIIICVVALYQVQAIHNQRSFPILIYASKWLFYISSMVYSIGRICGTIFYCHAPEYWIIPRNLLNISYFIHWVGVLLIYFGRLKLVFKDTIYKLKKRTIHCFSFTFMTLFILSFISCIGLYLGYGMFNLMAGVIVITAVILSQVLAWTFVGKLKAIQQDMGGDNMKERVKLERTVRKYSILSVTSVMGSSITALCMIVAVTAFHEDDMYMVSTVIGLIVVLDVFVNSLCMTLSLHTNDKWFRVFCCACIKRDEDKNQRSFGKVRSLSPTTLEMTSSTTDKSSQQNIITDVDV